MTKKILLADDSITIQKVISITFSSPDYGITIVDNGSDAIKKAAEVKPDIILTDIVMPGKNGYEVCDAVKSNPSLQNIPVLLLTGAFEAFDEQKAKQAGADAWLSKPFETQALIDKVNTLLSKPAVKKPAEVKPAAARPAVVPPRATPPPPPPPRRPSAAVQPPPSVQPVQEEQIEEIETLGEEESFEMTGDTIGNESNWETMPLGGEKEAASPAETALEEVIAEEELPAEKLPEEQPAEAPETPAPQEELSVGFGELEDAMEEAEEPQEQESVPGAEQYEKTYETKEVSQSPEEQIITHNEVSPAPPGLSKEELLQHASAQIEDMLKEILPEAVRQTVENKADAIIKAAAEKIIWEVVPALTETMIKEEIRKMKTAKKKP